MSPEDSICSGPNGTLLGQRARTQRVEPGNPFVEFLLTETRQNIATRFEQQASRGPHRVAIKEGSLSLSYEDLNRAANRTANEIIDEIGPGPAAIAVLAQQGVQSVIGLLGGLKAGMYCVLVDAALPVQRVCALLRDSGAGLVLVDDGNRAMARELWPYGLLPLDISAAARGRADHDLEVEVAPDSPAYIIYTSGSTGNPKGVVQSHRSALSSVRRSTNGRHIYDKDRVSLVARYGTGAWANDVFGALLNGATLLPFDVRRRGTTELAEWLAEEQVTVYHSVPTLFRHLAEDMAGITFPHMRLLQLSGEAAYESDFETYRERFPAGCLFHNRYGCSEAGVVCQHFMDRESQPEGHLLPVGYPADDIEIRLLEPSGNEVALGDPGEIVIRTPNLSPGYWGKADSSQDGFRPGQDGAGAYRTGDVGYFLPDGCLVHLGRKDSQCKIRGHRVEAGDVEQALARIPGVREAAVDIRPSPRGDAHLEAYVVLDGHAEWSSEGAIALLSSSLPDYMLPTAFHLIDSMPVTTAGKVDRRALAELREAAVNVNSGGLAPRTPIEEVLAELWGQVLGVERVGVTDNFFLLGGHSLVAGRLVARLRDSLGVEIPISCVFEAPTVEGLALRVVERLIDECQDEEIISLLEGAVDG